MLKKNVLIFFAFLTWICFFGSARAQHRVFTWETSKFTTNEGAQIHIIATGGNLTVNTDAGGVSHVVIHFVPALVGGDSYKRILIPLKNTGNATGFLGTRFQDKRWLSSALKLEPQQADTLETIFFHQKDTSNLVLKNMDGHPNGGAFMYDPIDAARIDSLSLEIRSTSANTFVLGNIIFEGSYITEKEFVRSSQFFPFIDRFGQFKHKEWPGKIHNEQELRHEAEIEDALLARKEAKDLDEYGGWRKGPNFGPSSDFRTVKYGGKWWLLDPAGHLFWSQGITCVGFGAGSTSIGPGRESYFTQLMPDTGIYQSIYEKRRGTDNYNFYVANLMKKYGVDWKDKSIERAHLRLKSWSINTIANWSDPEVYRFKKLRTAYTANISYNSPSVYENSAFNFPDVFAPAFRDSVFSGCKFGAQKFKDDPWCIGFFIDNELKLDSITYRVFRQEKLTATKRAFVKHIEKKYSSISEFNNLHQTSIETWDDLYSPSTFVQSLVPELISFDSLVLDQYFSVCRDATKTFAPNKLYLGNRFNLYRIFYPENPFLGTAIAAAARYCDVVSINYYRYISEDLELPTGLDKPIMIGEFHFGALDRGLPHTGLRNVKDQKQRALMYSSFIKEALKNPAIVGAHWFQYGDEPYTGRFDGENYQIGFVDVCDTPYSETVAAAKEVGQIMYQLRSETVDQ